MYKSKDLGGHSVVLNQVLDYTEDRCNLLVMTDDHADGLVHVYYGPSLHEAKLAIHKALGSDADQVISEIVDYLCSRT